MDFAAILQSMKNEKGVKYLPKILSGTGLPQNCLAGKYLTLFHLPGQTKLRSSNFGDNRWHVCRCLYDICKKTMILVWFEVTLLETKYKMSEIVNKRLLKVKNSAD